MVAIVPPLKKISSDGNNEQKKGQNNQQQESKGFSKVLTEIAEPVQSEISYKVSGYTKDAVAFYNIFKTRDYSYMVKA